MYKEKKYSCEIIKSFSESKSLSLYGLDIHCSMILCPEVRNKNALSINFELISIIKVSYLNHILNTVKTFPVPPVPIVQLKSANWDVFLSEKVELSCTVDGSSDWTFTWQRNKEELHGAPGFSFLGDGSVLTVSAENENQSGSYTCKGQHRTRGVSTKESSNAYNIKVNSKYNQFPLSLWGFLVTKSKISQWNDNVVCM